MGLSGAERQARYRARQAAEMERLRQAAAQHDQERHAPEPRPTANSENEALLEALFAEAQDRIEVLESELKTARQQQKTAEAKSRQRKPDEDKTNIELLKDVKSLRQRLAEARAELRHFHDWRKTTDLPERAGMSRLTYNRIIKALHSDHVPSEAERLEAMQAFNNWVVSLKPSRK